MDNHIALLCTLHPASQEKRDRCISMLRRIAREYYRQPEANCTAWSYFTPAQPPKPGAQAHLLAGIEIYTTKSALQAQLDDPKYFQPYHETVRREELYSKPENLEAWFFKAGFVARSSSRHEGGGRMLVSVSRLACTDKAGVEAVHTALTEFADWVHASEPGVHTYALFLRPKAPNEVMLFVRYADSRALKSHDQAPEHQNIMKLMGPYLDPKRTSTTVWRELDDSFVSSSPLVGGSNSSSSAKL